MSKTAVVGSAEIVVRAVTNRVRQDIEKAFKDAAPIARKAGSEAGSDWSDGFKASVGDNLRGNLNSAFSDVDASGAGRQAGLDFASGAAGGIGGGGGGVGDAAEKEFGDAGRRGGSAFSRALDSSFADSAVAASKAFTTIFAMGNIAGVGISGLVASISSVVSGLFSMASAASTAVGALGALPGLVGVLLQAGGALKLAFSGVGDALSAGLKPVAAQAADAATKSYAVVDAQKAVAKAANDAARTRVDANRKVISAENDLAEAVQDAGRAKQDADRKVADSRRSLSEAVADSAQVRQDADRKVIDASRAVGDAERELLDITRQLNAARLEAAESLQQLGFSAEGAALSEERAGMRLEEAHAKLVAARDRPVDDRGRREAELAYKEAELNFRQAKDRNSDLAEDQKKAAKAGIEGSNEVMSVKKQIAAAEEALANREQGLADAKIDRERRITDSAQKIAERQLAVADAMADRQQAIADASARIADRQQALDEAKMSRQRSLVDAQQQVADAQERLRRAQEAAAVSAAKGTAATNAYATAMANLSPEAQAFVKYLISIKGAFDDLKGAAGVELFPRLQTALEPIVAKTLPMLETQLRESGRILGDFAIGFSDALTRGSLFENLLKSQNETMDVFNRKGDNGRSVMDDLATVLLRVMTAVQPLTLRFAEWVATLIEGWEAATDTSAEMDKMTGFFNKSGDSASLLGSIIGNIIGIFRELGRAASPAGTGLLESFEEYTAGLEKLLKTPETQDSLGKYFEDVAVNMTAVSDLISDIGMEFAGLGDNQGIAGFAESFKPAIENFGTMMDNMTSSGPAFGEFLTNLSEIMVVLADSDGFTLFFETLNMVLGPLAEFAKSDLGGTLIKWVGGVVAITRALSLLGLGAAFAFRLLASGPIRVSRAFVAFKNGGIRGLIRSLTGMKGATGGAGKGLRGLGPASDFAKRAFERQMVTDNLKVKVLKQLELQALRTGGALKTLGRQALPPTAGKGAMAAGAAATAPVAGKAVNAAPVPRVAPAAVSVAPIAASSKAMGAGTKSAGLFGKAMGGMGKSMKGLGAAMSMLVGGPLGLLIVGIGALVFGLMALYKKSPQFKKFIDGIVNAVKPLIKAIGTFLVGALDKFFGWINSKLPAIKDFFGNVFGAIGKFITGTFIPIWQTKLVPVFQAAWAIIKPILGYLWTGVKVAFDLIKGYVTNVLIPAWGLVWQGLQKAWEFLKPVLSALWSGVKVAFDGVKGLITNVLVPAFRLIWQGMQAAWDIAKPIFGFLWSTVKTVFNGIGSVISWWYNNIVKRYFGLVGKVFQGAAIVAKWLWGKLKSAFNGIAVVTEWLWKKIRIAFNFIADKAKWLWNRIKESFNWWLSKAKSVSSWMSVQLVGRIRKAFNFIADKAKWLWNRIKESFNWWLSKAKSVSGWIKDVMVSRIRGAFNTIADKAGWLWEKIKTPFDKIKSGARAVRDGIGGTAKSIKKSWTRITGYLKDPIVKALKWLQNNFVSKMRSFLDKIPGVSKSIIPNIPIPKGWATGGYTGPGAKYAPAGIVHKDEYVIRKEATKKLIKTIGLGGLDHINRTGQMPGEGKRGSSGSTARASGIPGYYIGGKVKGLDPKFLKQLSEFNKAAGGRYSVNSGYRSNAHQALLYAKYRAGRGPVAAPPGSSRHNFGLAADLAPGNARDVHASLAKKFGLIFTVPSESWHIEPTWGRSGKGGGGFDFGLPDWAKSPVKWVKDKFKGITDGFDAKKYGLAGKIIPAVLGKVQTAVKNKVKDAASLLSFGGDDGGDSGSGAKGSPRSVESWRPTVLKALRILGLPNKYADSTLRRMNQESTGDPRAINRWDINALRGDPSKGLMQVIGSTFRAYAHPKYSRNIYDPLSNILASMRYAISRYGNLWNAYDRKGGYASGTDSAMSGLRMVGEFGPELVNFKGGEQVYNRQQTLRLASLAAKAKQNASSAVDSAGLSARDRAMIDLIRQSLSSDDTGKGDTFHVHPAPGMNEGELATLVSRRVAWRKSVGT